jgi:hypothetical protein
MGLALATTAFADVITLKNGRVINGTYLGGSPRQVKVEVGDQIMTLDVSDSRPHRVQRHRQHVERAGV